MRHTHRPRPTLRLLAPIGLILVTAAPAIAQDKAPAMDLVMEVQGPPQGLSVWIDGVPVARLRGDRPSHFLNLTAFFVDGGNRVELRWPDGATIADIEVTLLSWPAGQPRSASRMLLSYPPPEGETAVSSATRTFSIEVALPVRWAWQDADSVQRIAPSDREQILQVLRHLHEALAGKDAAAYVDILRPLLEDASPGRPGSADRLRPMLAGMMADPAWKVAPLADSAIRMTPYGRLVEVAASGPLLSATTSGQQEIGITRLFFARLHGRWIPIRQALD